MDRTEKITVAMSFAVTVGSAALFFVQNRKARSRLVNKQVQADSTIKTVATNANTLTA